MKRSSFSAAALPPFIAQIILFFLAAAVLTLLYLSYRPGDYLASFVVTGMLLTVPWLVLSLLPTLLVLKDRELRRELLWNQVITILSAFVLLCGISVYTGFDAALLDYLGSYLDAAGYAMSDFLTRAISLSRQVMSFVAELYRHTIAPLFSFST